MSIEKRELAELLGGYMLMKGFKPLYTKMSREEWFEYASLLIRDLMLLWEDMDGISGSLLEAARQQYETTRRGEKHD